LQRKFSAPCAHVEIRNPNLEIRNKFKARMIEIQNLQRLAVPRSDVGSIWILNFGFVVSDFDIRASDLVAVIDEP